MSEALALQGSFADVELQALKSGGIGLRALAAAQDGSDAIGYTFMCLRYYDDVAQGFKGLGLAQHLRKLLRFLDETASSISRPETIELHALVVTTKPLAVNKPMLNTIFYQRATENIEVVRYTVAKRYSNRIVISPQLRGIRFWYDLSGTSLFGTPVLGVSDEELCLGGSSESAPAGEEVSGNMGERNGELVEIAKDDGREESVEQIGNGLEFEAHGLKIYVETPDENGLLGKVSDESPSGSSDCEMKTELETAAAIEPKLTPTITEFKVEVEPVENQQQHTVEEKSLVEVVSPKAADAKIEADELPSETQCAEAKKKKCKKSRLSKIFNSCAFAGFACLVRNKRAMDFSDDEDM